jgi:hypothetical protein
MVEIGKSKAKKQNRREQFFFQLALKPSSLPRILQCTVILEFQCRLIVLVVDVVPISALFFSYLPASGSGVGSR